MAMNYTRSEYCMYLVEGLSNKFFPVVGDHTKSSRGGFLQT